MEEAIVPEEGKRNYALSSGTRREGSGKRQGVVHGVQVEGRFAPGEES